MDGDGCRSWPLPCTGDGDISVTGYQTVPPDSGNARRHQNGCGGVLLLRIPV